MRSDQKKVQNENISFRELKKTEKTLRNLMKTINNFGSDRERRFQLILSMIDERVKKLNQHDKKIDDIKKFIEKDAIDNIISSKTSSLNKEKEELENQLDSIAGKWDEQSKENKKLDEELKKVQNKLSKEKEHNSILVTNYEKLKTDNQVLSDQIKSDQQFSKLKGKYIAHIESQIAPNSEVIELIKNDEDKFEIVLNMLFGCINYQNIKELDAIKSKIKDESFSKESVKSIAIYFSMLLIQYGTETPGFQNLLSCLNNLIEEYRLEEPDPIGHPVDPERHYVTKEEQYNTIERVHTLPIYNKQLGKITKKAIIESV